MKSKTINILIADDNKEFTAVLSAFLRRDSRFKVVSVSHDGEEALKQIRLKKPDVIILDIIMPYLDGIEVKTQYLGADWCFHTSGSSFSPTPIMPLSLRVSGSGS